MSLSRRHFTQLSALGLASRLVPSSFGQAAAAAPARKTGYCIVGIGRIADHYLRGMAATDSSAVTAFVSGHRDKALKFAAQYGVPESSIYSYEQFDAIRDNKAIDATIICLPNSMHAEYTIRSAKAGKHVLCEKPMATSVADCQTMIAACAAARVKLMIAYRLHYEPVTMRTIKLIRDGGIGKIQAIDSANGYNIARGEWRATKALGGGGPLMDVGIYCLNATRYLTGEEPASFTATVSTVDHDGRFDTVEENTAWTSTFPSGAVATCSTTYGANQTGYYRVYGSKGWLEVAPFHYEGQRLQAQYRDDTLKRDVRIDETSPDHDPSHFTRQLNHFTECVTLDHTPLTPGEEGLRDMQYMQAIYRAAGIANL